MNNITVDFSTVTGKIKPMHSVNNGPVESDEQNRAGSNFGWYKAAGIPFARNHDASFYEGYGGEHIVDVHRIFKRFEADENDPASYTFGPTDSYVANSYAAGTEVLYRLGASIEHRYKFGTYPPADFQKWARICEHIIRHYNEGWANGFHYNIEYWEIWNEPDCEEGSGHNPCWQGTREQFADFFCTVVGHLKSCFPDLKIGGPAFCSPWRDEYSELIFSEMNRRNIPLDFFSFHGYNNNPHQYIDYGNQAKLVMKKYGFDNAELILDEWNYITEWSNEGMLFSQLWMKELTGASFLAASMMVAQRSLLDHFMYYDAKPSQWCAMFDTLTLRPLKGYYSFPMFNTLYRMGTEVASETDDDLVYALGASGEDCGAILLTYYSNDTSLEKKDIKLSLKGLESGNWKISFYLLDETHDNTLVREEYTSSANVDLFLNLPLYSTYLVKLSKI